MKNHAALFCVINPPHVSQTRGHSRRDIGDRSLLVGDHRLACGLRGGGRSFAFYRPPQYCFTLHAASAARKNKRQRNIVKPKQSRRRSTSTVRTGWTSLGADIYVQIAGPFSPQFGELYFQNSMENQHGVIKTQRLRRHVFSSHEIRGGGKTLPILPENVRKSYELAQS